MNIVDTLVKNGGNEFLRSLVEAILTKLDYPFPEDHIVTDPMAEDVKSKAFKTEYPVDTLYDIEYLSVAIAGEINKERDHLNAQNKVMCPYVLVAPARLFKPVELMTVLGFKTRYAERAK